MATTHTAVTTTPEVASGRDTRTGEPAVALRRDAAGDPRVSATFVLHRAPAPDERLGPLLERAVLALEVELTADPDGANQALLVDDITVELVRRPDGDGPVGEPLVVATAHGTGPFAHLAIDATVVDAEAGVLLEALVAGGTGHELRARATLPGPPATPARVRVALGALWSALDAVADDTRHVHLVDLRNYLPGWREQGVVQVEEGEDDDAILSALLRGARFALWPAGPEVEPPGVDHADLGPAYQLAATSPGDTDVVATEQLGGAQGTLVEQAVDLGELVGAAIRHDPSRFVHLVTTAGGQVDAVLPARTVRRTRATEHVEAHVAEGGRVASLTSVLHPRPSRPELASSARFHAVAAPHAVAFLADLELVAPGFERRPGPLVDRVDAPLWRDRWDAGTAWYVPAFTLVRPDPARAVDDDAPFRFDVEATGHDVSGRVGLVATITLTLATATSPETERARAEAGDPELRVAPLSGLTVQLGVPFRDERGDTRVEQVVADEVEVVGTLGEPDARVAARVRLLDDWARLAYGALSTAGFQTRDATVTVAATLEAWRPVRVPPTVLGADKRWALTGHPTMVSGTRAPGRRPVATAATALPAVHAMPVATASIRPAWQVRPDLVAEFARVEHEWSRFALSRSTPASVPCADFGSSYRERHDEVEWRAIGCRPDLQLGQTEYRTHEQVAVAAAGDAKVYRSLQRPGRFLVVPATYAVGRYEPEDGERAYRPALLLHSTIDVDVPTNIRCVLAAALQPSLPSFRREAILEELRRTAHPDPVLEYLPDCGVAPQMSWAVPGTTQVESVATPTGFDVVCTTDPAGFLVLRSMLERTGLRGVATVDLPGGVRLSTSLVVDLGSVTGPFHAGPVELTPTRDGRLDMTNHTGQRVAVVALASGGVDLAPVGMALEPGATTPVDHPGGDGRLDAVHEVDAGAEALEEIRAYIEDLELGLVFVATSDPADAGLAGLEITTRLGEQIDTDPLLLTSDDRQVERSYLLPLTRFVEDPVLRFTVTAVGADGSRRSGPAVDWPVRSRGVLIPVGPPTG